MHCAMASIWETVKLSRPVSLINSRRTYFQDDILQTDQCFLSFWDFFSVLSPVCPTQNDMEVEQTSGGQGNQSLHAQRSFQTVFCTAVRAWGRACVSKSPFYKRVCISFTRLTIQLQTNRTNRFSSTFPTYPVQSFSENLEQTPLGQTLKREARILTKSIPAIHSHWAWVTSHYEYKTFCSHLLIFHPHLKSCC